MIIYNRYIDNQDYTWYDSSNLVFSKCYDNKEQNKTLKIVFKDGRTYLYKDVDVTDYMAFKTATSNGKAINEFITKKYKGTRISDTNIEKLETLKNNFINEETNVNNEIFSNLSYHLNLNEETGEFKLKLNNKTIYTGIEGQVSIINLLKSLNINYSWTTVDRFDEENDENKDELILD